MSAIDTYLGYIASKRYAKDVRTAIVNAIRECYNNVNSPTLREAAFIAAIEAELENGHLTGLEFVQVDDTLSNEGEAADAKATGDAIGALNASLGDIEPILNGFGTGSPKTVNIAADLTWELGAIKGTDGQDDSNNVKRARAIGYIDVTSIDSITLTPASGCNYSIRLYDSSKVYDSVNKVNLTSETTVVDVTNYSYIRVWGSNTDGTTNLSDSDLAATKAGCVINAVIPSNGPSLINTYTALSRSRGFGASYSLADAEWESGSITSQGEDSTDTHRGRIVGYIDISDIASLTLIPDTGYKYSLRLYDSTKTVVQNISLTTDITSVNVENYTYLRVWGGKTTDATLSTDDIAELKAGCCIIMTPWAIADDYNYLPDYWKDELTNKSDALMEKLTIGRNSYSFAFPTDMHWTDNKKHTPALLKKITETFPLNDIVLGGDYINWYEDKQYAIDLLNDVIRRFSACGNTYPMFGNHDNNAYSVASQYHLSKDEVFGVIHGTLPTDAVYGEEFYFYFDRPVRKTRIICLSSGDNAASGEIDSTQLSWLSGILSATPADYHVIICCHWLFTLTQWNTETPVGNFTSSASTLFAMCDSNNADSSKAKIECIIGAHIHSDWNQFTTGGIPIIFCDADAVKNGGTAGTITEACLNIITVDYDAEKVYTTEFGRGTDRTISY